MSRRVPRLYLAAQRQKPKTDEENWKMKSMHKQLMLAKFKQWCDKPDQRDFEGIMENKSYLILYLFIN